jgi:hypothetical protein
VLSSYVAVFPSSSFLNNQDPANQNTTTCQLIQQCLTMASERDTSVSSVMAHLTCRQLDKAMTCAAILCMTWVFRGIIFISLVLIGSMGWKFVCFTFLQVQGHARGKVLAGSGIF